MDLNDPKLTPAEKRKLAALRPWGKGKSGNPTGRPKDPAILRDFKQTCREICDSGEILKQLRTMMNDGNVKAAELICHYGIGKPVEKIEHEGALTVNVVFKNG